VIVPGVLGYGWEWDEAAAQLAKTPGVDFFVFDWAPWGTLRAAARELRAALADALWHAPRSVRQVVVVAHSMGGNVAAHALDGLPVPPGRRLTVVTIGAPLAGMLGPPLAYEDALGSPAMMSVVSTFERYPPVPRGAEMIEYVTAYPSDPVMQPRWGHEVAPPEIGPRGARRVRVDPRFDHNRVVSKVVNGILNDGRPPERIAP
jgi:pimeloyl-ACP methyl ester carboxylesterase